MDASPNQQDLALSIVLKTFPESRLLDKGFLREIVAQRSLDYASDEVSDEVLHMNIAAVVDQIQEHLPLILTAAQLVLTYLEVAALREKRRLSPEVPNAQKVTEELKREYAVGGAPSKEITKAITQSTIELMNNFK